mmetsp:Transcript_30589/g.56093  ORF Transcript_30589/g.56093 Transcript_30589/m.56093 type:complete len:164 (+) Transcript_30589:60-551(+)
MAPTTNLAIALCAFTLLLVTIVNQNTESNSAVSSEGSKFTHASILPTKEKELEMGSTSYSWEEVARRDGTTTGEEGGLLWVIVNDYVLDLTSFAQHHPAGAQKIIDRRKKSIDITSNFLDHFGHTVLSFREACQRYDQEEETVVLEFSETVGKVRIIGKMDLG